MSGDELILARYRARRGVTLAREALTESMGEWLDYYTSEDRMATSPPPSSLSGFLEFCASNNPPEECVDEWTPLLASYVAAKKNYSRMNAALYRHGAKLDKRTTAPAPGQEGGDRG